MKTVAVISAMPVELEGFVSALHAEELKLPGFYRVFRAVYGAPSAPGGPAQDESGANVVLACSGIGKVNAAACTQRVVDEFHPDAVVNMGIAGGLSDKLQTLDIVIGSAVVYHDFTPASLLKKYYPFRSEFRCDPGLVRLAEETCAAEGSRCLTGRIASGDCFVESGETKARIRDGLGALCCEMEGASIGHTAFLNKVPFLILRSISDLADDSAQMSYKEFERKASVQANRIVLGLIGRVAAEGF